MAEYTAREWSGGDIVTAANLNHLEQGVETAQGGGVLIIEETITESSTATTYTLNKTWQEIHDAMISGTVCLVHFNTTHEEGYASVLMCDVTGDGYEIITRYSMYTINNPADYPINTISTGGANVQ